MKTKRIIYKEPAWTIDQITQPPRLLEAELLGVSDSPTFYKIQVGGRLLVVHCSTLFCWDADGDLLRLFVLSSGSRSSDRDAIRLRPTA